MCIHLIPADMRKRDRTNQVNDRGVTELSDAAAAVEDESSVVSSLLPRWRTACCYSGGPSVTIVTELWSKRIDSKFIRRRFVRRTIIIYQCRC